ncbi:MAG TPA: sugar ABC transporter ATP-binding protein [Anaeromyxobacter sp.]|nr:sugar ABC transporter ATP-binding protein [Anaeromyxobacter sp.]
MDLGADQQKTSLEVGDGGAFQFLGVGKSFFGVPVLKDVTLTLRPGTVLGLVGENGAGKSTLMNVMGGVLRPDTGRMLLGGASYAPAGPEDARGAGIGFIHQELNLFSNLSVAENMFIESFPTLGRIPAIDRRRMAAGTREHLAQIGLDISPSALVETLSPGERQLVEIAKGLAMSPRIFIFDEPTTSLTAKETRQLFDIIRTLRARGTSIIYISHILGHVAELADEVAVLRNGELVADGPAAEYPIPRMIASMVGRDLKSMFPPKASQPQPEVLLRVEGLSQAGIVRDIELTVHKGEIVGLFGLMGSGRTELARMIFGVDRYERGTVRVGDALLPRGNPRAAIERGMSFVTENRREEGLLMNVSIADNIGLVALPEFARPITGYLRRRRLQEATDEKARELRIKAGSYEEQPAKSLSGGNQQKVVLAKWLLAAPRILLVDEPTRGIDVGAKYEVYTIIGELARRGSGVLYVSSELEELLAVADRILVMNRGEIVGRFERNEFAEERVMRAAFRHGEGVRA